MKNLILTIVISLGIATILMARDNKNEIKEIEYRRSSLHTILIESDDFPRKETVLKAYYEAPFPAKYNDHTIGAKSFNPNNYTISDEERIAAGVQQSEAGKLMKGMASDVTAGIVDSLAADIPLIINKYFTENKIANQIAAKWFNRRADGSFDMKLVGERGYYNATEMEANIAKGSARGTASLADAGEELISNTFVVVSKLKYVSNEVVASIIRDVAIITANQISNSLARDAAIKTANKVYEKTKEGYSVWTTSFLYQLKWNDSIATAFYNDLWMDNSNIDPLKKEAFDNTDLFELEYIGKEKAISLVTFSLKEDRTEDQIVELATIRNIDAVYAKLQKKYDVFKTKTPLYSGYPIMAKIGMKEGLEGGEKFEVLEQIIDPKTGLTKYVSKGKITVDKKSLWDNRFIAGTTIESESLENEATQFKGGKNFHAGMLIRQLK